MGGSFETSDSHSSRDAKPIRVPVRRENIFSAAVEMAGDMEGWEIVSETKGDTTDVVVCRVPGGFLAGESAVTITVEGPNEIPNTTVNAKSISTGGLRSSDKANVTGYMKILFRRIC